MFFLLLFWDFFKLFFHFLELKCDVKNWKIWKWNTFSRNWKLRFFVHFFAFFFTKKIFIFLDLRVKVKKFKESEKKAIFSAFPEGLGEWTPCMSIYRYFCILGIYIRNPTMFAFFTQLNLWKRGQPKLLSKKFCRIILDPP